MYFYPADTTGARGARGTRGARVVVVMVSLCCVEHLVSLLPPATAVSLSTRMQETETWDGQGKVQSPNEADEAVQISKSSVRTRRNFTGSNSC